MSQHNHSINLETINNLLVKLSIDTNEIITALEVVQTNDLQSKSIIDIVIMALSNNVSLTTDMIEQIDDRLLSQRKGGEYYE